MKIALYSRVSSVLQEKENTIESQIAELESWAKINNHIIIERYIDNGYSGTLLARPELDRLRDDATKGLFEAVVIHSPDRLARKFVYQEIVVDELKNNGIQAIFLNRPLAETPEDQLLLNVQGIIAEYERAKLLERTRRGKLHRVKNGNIIGNIPPYGYKLVKKTESKTGLPYYAINEEEASIVRKIFSLLVEEQMTTYKILLELDRLKLLSRNGKRWAKSSIAKILRNETYTGVTYYNKHYGVPSTNGQKYHKRKNSTFKLRPKEEWIPISGIPQIIDSDIFLKAQKQLTVNSKLSPRNTKQNYLLKGLLKCSKDNRAYYGVPMHGKPFYRCSGKDKLVSPVRCPSSSISARVIEPFVWDTLLDLLNQPSLILNQLKRKASLSLSNASRLAEKIKDLELHVNKIDKEEKRLIQAYSEGVITLEQLKEQNLRLQEKKNNLFLEREKFINQRKSTPLNVSIKNARIYIREFKNTLDNLTFEKKQLILRTLLKEIVINDKHLLISGFLPIQPHNALLRPQYPDEGATWCRQNTPCADASFYPT